MSKELEALNDIEKAFKLILNADISTTKEFKLIKQALTELETLKTQNRNAYKEGYEQGRFDERMENEVKKNDL